jgi:hypothetical protein
MAMGEADEDALSEDDLQSRHCSARTASLDLFHQLARFGGKEAQLATARDLDKDLAQQFQQVLHLIWKHY